MYIVIAIIWFLWQKLLLPCLGILFFTLFNFLQKYRWYILATFFFLLMASKWFRWFVQAILFHLMDLLVAATIGCNEVADGLQHAANEKGLQWNWAKARLQFGSYFFAAFALVGIMIAYPILYLLELWIEWVDILGDQINQKAPHLLEKEGSSSCSKKPALYEPSAATAASWNPPNVDVNPPFLPLLAHDMAAVSNRKDGMVKIYCSGTRKDGTRCRNSKVMASDEAGQVFLCHIHSVNLRFQQLKGLHRRR